MGNRKGLIIVYTGDGKGKTTAALGAALRACGKGMNTLMIQFLKQRGVSGEQEVCPSLLKNIEIYPFGNGFIHDGDDIGPHREMAQAGWRFMEEKLKQTKYDMVILDEIAPAVNFHLLSTDMVKSFLTQKTGGLHVILTGKNMPKELMEIADTVTEMKEIKHAYQKGIDATPGLDY